MVDRLRTRTLDDAVESASVRDVDLLQVRLLRDELSAPGREIVDDDSVYAISEKSIDDMRANEPGSASNDGRSRRHPSFRVRRAALPENQAI